MKPESTHPEWRWLYAGLVLTGAAFFLFSVHAVLSPLVTYILLVLLLSPFSRSPYHRTAVLALTLAMSLWLLETMGGLLAPFVFAFVLAYILDPAVDALQRRGLRRGVAVTVLVLPALVLIGVAIAFAVPALVNQVEAFATNLPEAAARLGVWMEDTRARALRMNLPFLSDDVLRRWLDPARIAAFVEEQQAEVAQRAWQAVTGFGRGLGIVLSLLGFIVLVPVLVVYLLRDFDHITARVAELMPPSRREGWLAFLREYDGLLSRFLRGQVVAASIVGVLTWLGLWIAGVPYSGLVGAVAGVFNLVPYLGLIVSIVPVFIIALISGSFVATLLKAAVVFVIVQGIDGSITGPRIVGSSVGLHPVWVLLALAIGSFFFGFVGLLVAMPAAVLIKLLLREALGRYRLQVGSPAATMPRAEIPDGEQ